MVAPLRRRTGRLRSPSRQRVSAPLGVPGSDVRRWLTLPRCRTVRVAPNSTISRRVLLEGERTVCDGEERELAGSEVNVPRALWLNRRGPGTVRFESHGDDGVGFAQLDEGSEHAHVHVEDARDRRGSDSHPERLLSQAVEVVVDLDDVNHPDSEAGRVAQRLL